MSLVLVLRHMGSCVGFHPLCDSLALGDTGVMASCYKMEDEEWRALDS